MSEYNPYLPDRNNYAPEKYKLESQLQADCAFWFWNRFIAERRMLFHVDNNSYNRVIGSKKKALGVVSGPSDFIFIVDSVIFIEMKLPGETQSDAQIDFMNKVVEKGHKYIIIEYFEQFKKYVTFKIVRQ